MPPSRPHQILRVRDLRRIGQHFKRCDQTVEGVLYHRSQQTIPVPEVMLNDTPTHPSPFDDVPSTGR